MKGRDSMGYDGKLTFDTKIDESGFNSGVSRLGNIAKSGLQVLASAVAGVTTAMGTGVVVGMKYNASIEQYQTSFEVMTGSAEKAAEVIENLKKVGAETPFELDNLAETTQLLMNYGFTADDAMDKMMLLGDISQGSAEKMKRIATAYGQMSSAGKVSLEDVKQMIEAGFNPLQEISENTGESMASLYERISDGTVAVDEITAAMQRATSEGGKYFQSMEKQSQTINGLISTLKDNAMQLLGEVVQPATEAFRTELLPSAIEVIEELSDEFESNGVKGLIEVGKNILLNLVDGIYENIPSMIASGSDMLANFLTGIGERLPELAPKALEMVVMLSDTLIANTPKIIEAGGDLIKGLIQGIVNSIPTLIAEGPRIINEFCSIIYATLGEVVALGLELIVSLVKGLWDNKGLLLENAGQIFLAFLNIFSLSNLFSLGKGLLTNLTSGIKALASNPKQALKDIFTKAINTVKNMDWKNLGKNILDGIVTGIKKNVANIISALVGAAQSALSSVKRFLGIKSPSTRFRDEVGKDMALGIGVGFDKNIPVDDMAGTLSNSVQRMKKKVSSVTQDVGADNASRISKVYISGNSTERDPEDVTVIVENHFEVDGTKLVDKTTKATIKKINGMQVDANKSKGK